jgi:hypothetical protein
VPLSKHPFRSLGKTYLKEMDEEMTALSSGVIFVHSAPRALSPHVEWAVSRVLGRGVTFSWAPQPILEGTQRTEYYWQGPAGSGAALASSLRGWSHLRYEITENAFSGGDGGRWCHTPALGIFHAQTDAVGNMVVNENQLRLALQTAGPNAQALQTAVDHALGTAWDAELDVFRYARDDATVTWLHHVG